MINKLLEFQEEHPILAAILLPALAAGISVLITDITCRQATTLCQRNEFISPW